MTLRFMIAFLLSATASFAQTQDIFEVAVVKPSRPGTRMSSTSDRAQFRCAALTLMQLIQSAYPDNEIPPWKVAGGPGWLTTDLWDLTAKLPPGMPTELQPLYRRTEAMLRIFLAEEFQLVTHRETRDFPVYALQIAKTGSKLKPSEVSEFDVKTSRGRLEFRHQSMEGLVRFLYFSSAYQNAVDRPVIDKTGLEGFYDFTLEWTPDTVEYDPAATGSSIYTAIEQQLGLKLQPQKEPLEFLVIDHAAKPTGGRQ